VHFVGCCELPIDNARNEHIFLYNSSLCVIGILQLINIYLQPQQILLVQSTTAIRFGRTDRLQELNA